jgi:hypothetical protein
VRRRGSSCDEKPRETSIFVRLIWNFFIQYVS